MILYHRQRPGTSCGNDHSILILLFCYLAFCLESHSTTAIPLNDDFMLEHWSVEDGLPGTQAISLAQSTDGYIWIGTHYGIARFDGIKFTVFDDTTPGIPPGSCFEIKAARQGTLWLKFGKTLVYYENGQFTPFPENKRLPGQIRMLTSTASGHLIIGAIHRESKTVTILELSSTRIVHRRDFPNPQALKFVSLAATADPSGKTWWRFGPTIGEISDKGFVETNRDRSWNRKLRPITGSLRGGIWVLTGNGISRLDNNRWIKDEIELQPTHADSVTQIREDGNGDLWLSLRKLNPNSDASLAKYEPNTHGILEHSQIIELGPRSATLIDHQNEVWLAKGSDMRANRSGLFHLRKRHFHDTKTIPELNKPIHSFAESLEGELIIGTYQDTYAVKSSQHFLTPFEPPAALTRVANGKSWTLLTDAPHSIWIGKYSLNLAPAPTLAFANLHLDETHQVIHTNVSVSLKRPRTTAICKDKEGVIWIGDITHGLLKIADGEQTRFTEPFLPNNHIQSLACDPEGTIWIGTNQTGILCYKDEAFYQLTEAEGSPTGQIRAILVEPDGTLWFATGGRGIYRYQEGVFTEFSTKHGLPTNEISTIVDDGVGHLWFGSYNGVHRVAKRDLQSVAKGSKKILYVESFDLADGLSSLQCSSGHPSSLRTHDGRLWFATVEGANVVNPRTIPNSRISPPVHLEDVILDGIPYNHEARTSNSDTNGKFRIASDVKRIEFAYTGISFANASEILFRYQLTGDSDEWNEVGTQRSVIIPRLEPGEYRFRVQCANGPGNWSPQAATLEFIVVGRFWESKYFAVYLVIGLVLLIVGGIRIRWIQIERRQAAKDKFTRNILEHQEADRKRIASELHDSLEQNLLVIKNRALLTQRKGKNTESTDKALQEISEISSSSIEEVRSIASNLRPYQIDRLGLQKAIQSMLNQVANASGLSINYEIEETSRKLSPQLQITLYRIVQEATNNILKHSNASQATVTLLVSDVAITLRVKDNGSGFEPAEVEKRAGKGFGVSGIQERANMMKGTCDLKTARGAGTEWVIRFPSS